MKLTNLFNLSTTFRHHFQWSMIEKICNKFDVNFAQCEAYVEVMLTLHSCALPCLVVASKMMHRTDAPGSIFAGDPKFLKTGLNFTLS